MLSTDFVSKNNHYDAAIIRSKEIVNKRFLTSFPNLKIVSSATSGFDHFILNEIEGLGVKFCYSPNANVQSAAELTLLHILYCLKNARTAFTTLNKAELSFGEELLNKKVLLIGFGRIGKKVSQLLTAFGSDIYAYDPYVDADTIRKNGVTPTGFIEGLKFCDLISLHCPLTKKTKHLINDVAFSEMNSHTFIINCSRGEILSTHALIKALNENQIAGASLDVAENEPLSQNSPLTRISNVNLTPHIGGFTEEAHTRSALEAAAQVHDFFKEPTKALNFIPPPVEWVKDL